MSDIRDKVTACFRNVFPDLRPQDIPSAEAESVAGWDSIAQVTLVSAVAEEFGLALQPDDYERLNSYALIVAFVETQLA